MSQGKQRIQLEENFNADVALSKPVLKPFFDPTGQLPALWMDPWTAPWAEGWTALGLSVGLSV